ncbi:MAG: hypothetical protein L6U99_09575 [Clostridium sp.]|nr:MAG: hypothetical protein L6U99_09575 [Clostridium sp.]
MKKKFIAFLLFLCFIVTTSSLAIKAAAPDTVTKDGVNYKLVTATADVTDGNYLMANADGTKFMGALSGKFHSSVEIASAVVFSIETTDSGMTIKKIILQVNTLHVKLLRLI